MAGAHNLAVRTKLELNVSFFVVALAVARAWFPLLVSQRASVEAYGNRCQGLYTATPCIHYHHRDVTPAFLPARGAYDLYTPTSLETNSWSTATSFRLKLETRSTRLSGTPPGTRR